MVPRPQGLALRKAIRRGWIRHEGGVLFKLLGTGFDRAREYAKEMGTGKVKV
jgi:hypothetical protein